MKTLSIICVVCCACVWASAEAAEPKINVSQLWPSNVSGRLGKPLGKRMTIEGQYTKAKLAKPFAVTKVDGEKVREETIISIQGKVVLEKGVTYRFEGYESGRFGSSPGWSAPGASQPFQFYSFFVVTSILKPGGN